MFYNLWNQIFVHNGPFKIYLTSYRLFHGWPQIMVTICLINCVPDLDSGHLVGLTCRNFMVVHLFTCTYWTVHLIQLHRHLMPSSRHNVRGNRRSYYTNIRGNRRSYYTNIRGNRRSNYTATVFFPSFQSPALRIPNSVFRTSVPYISWI
jgi:hypothetical protein